MALRRQIPEPDATFPDPFLGVNLRAAEDDLAPGEARLLQNLVYDGGTRKRTGSQRINSSSLGAFRIRGGHKFYYGGASPTSKRLIAFSNRISVLSDGGTETNLTTGMTSDKDTHFTTWSITDKAYIGNDTDTLRTYDGTTFATLGGTNPPVARTGVAPILDRIMCITTNGIERSNARVDNAWSANSSWATLRPSRVGLFTALKPFTIRGTDTLYPGLIAFQANAYYVVTGTKFGDDVTAGTAANDDASIKLLDPNVGTSSPYSVLTVPGVGLFWFTSDLNVYWLPEGSLTGTYVGDKLQSTGSTSGIESTNTAALGQVWMEYVYPFVMLGIPTGSDAYATTQFWLDVRRLPKEPVWYGPMTGQQVGRAWTETQNGDNAIYGGEGNSSTGAFVYKLRVASRWTDAVGTSDNAVMANYRSMFQSFGYPSRQKYVQAVNADLYVGSGTPTCALYDLDGQVAASVSFTAL